MAAKKIGNKVLSLVVGDITAQELDAFVYDITEDCKLGSGYGGAIAGRAGRTVQLALDEQGSCKTGDAVITEAGKLKARFIIHTNGPKFHEPETEDKLRRAVQSCLSLADDNGLETIAFPPIGTGLYQVPLDACATIMLDTIRAHLEGDTPLKEVRLVALDSREYRPFEARFQGGV